MRGRLADIRRLSVHDGPGIRTTLFLKGCPLRCRWCHNPETLAAGPEVGFRRTKCSGCGTCANVCPAGVHSLSDGIHTLQRQRCIGCGKCVEACRRDALEYYGREVPVAAAVAAVLEDKTFYDQSGGGCTLSGGEPLLQPGFCAAVCRRLRQAGVHCAIDTSGAVPWRSLLTVLPHTDLFLYDVKHTDPKVHARHTGGSNRRILANLKRLAACDVPIEIRIPVIPGFNADLQALSAIGGSLRGLRNIVGVRLLPYHLARTKYEMLGQPDTMPEVAPPTPDQMAAAAACLRGLGLAVR